MKPSALSPSQKKQRKFSYKGKEYYWQNFEDKLEFDSILNKKRHGVISPSRGEMSAMVEGFIKKGSLVCVIQPSTNPFENKGKSYVDRVNEWSYVVNPTKKGISDEEAF